MKTFFIILCLVVGGRVAVADTTQIKSSPDKPDRLYVDSDTQNMNSYDHTRWTAWWIPDDLNNADAWNWEEGWNTNHFDLNWSDGQGGSGSSYSRQIGQQNGGIGGTNVCAEQMSWPGTNWENFRSVDGTGIFTGNGWGSTPTNVPVDISPPPTASESSGSIGGESCNESDPYGPESTYGYVIHFIGDDYEYYEDDGTYTRTAQTKMKLLTGGMDLPHRQSLFCIGGWAADMEKSGSGKRAQPAYIYPGPQLPYTETVMGSLGALKSDGNLWVVLPDGAPPYDVTPQVGRPFYIFGANETKYKLTITASGVDLYTNVPEFCVGQQIDLVANWNPSLPDGTQKWPQWTLGGDFIDNFYYPSGCTTCSMVYTNDPTYLTNESSQAWWIWGDYDNPPTYMADFSEDLMLPNGQRANMAALGKIKMFRPKVEFSPDGGANVVLSTNGLPSIYLGVGDNSAGSMGWQNIVYLNPQYSASIYYTQLIYRNWDWDRQGWLGGYLPKSDHTGDYLLDTEIKYSAATVINNSGSHSIETLHFGDGPDLEDELHSYADCQDSFETYLEFQPIGGIPVTIGVIEWGWQGRVDGSYSSSTWSLTTNSITGPQFYNYYDDFPEWPSIYTGN